MSEDVIVTGLTELIATFGKVRVGLLPAVDAVVEKAAVNVKTDAARRVSGLAHAPAYPASITYDLFHTPFTSRATIGPDKDKRQGALGNLLEYGSVKNAPIPHMHPAADAEEPRFVAALGQAEASMWDRS